MKRFICVLVVAVTVCLWTAAASAETDRVARSRVRKLEASVKDLQTQIVALQLLVERLQQRSTEQEKEIKANYALIRMLAGQGREPQP